MLLWPIGTAFGLYTIVLLLLTFFEGGGVGVRGKRLLYIVEGAEVQVPGISYVCWNVGVFGMFDQEMVFDSWQLGWCRCEWVPAAIVKVLMI